MKVVTVFAVIFPVVMLVANAVDNSVTVGQSFYLREKDILSPLHGGVHIFKKFDDSCYKWEKQQGTFDDRSAYENDKSFYNQISSDSSLSVELIGEYTMGATLNVKTGSTSSGKTDIKGESINVGTYVNASYLDQDCFKGSKSELTDDLINMFDSLLFRVPDPRFKGSWQPYETFLKTFGSHFVTETKLGVIVRQWTFSKADLDYTFKQLNIRACLDIAGPTDVGELNLGACRGVTEEEARTVANLETSNHFEIYGGSDETRHRFLISRSREDLTQLLNEGRTKPSPTSYEYMAIWDILMMKFYDNPTRHAKAMNMMHYYYGYADFGCTYLSDAANRDLRYFEYSLAGKLTPNMPAFRCVLIKEGCQTDDDCHIGGAGSVTYCYGQSCYEYVQPAFGSKAESVSARTTESGSTYAGINLSCHYYFIGGKCRNPFNPRTIWSGEELAQKATLRQTKCSSACQNFRHYELYLYSIFIYIFISYIFT